MYFPSNVSIHAPTWGATSRGSVDLQSIQFQSTRPRGARPVHLLGRAALIVSIHAPTWGATPFFSIVSHMVRFQSTRPRGARLSVDLFRGVKKCFNPRAHVGRDDRYQYYHRSQCSFNPRAHVGRDFKQLLICSPTRVSIHAPTWGATQCSLLQR